MAVHPAHDLNLSPPPTCPVCNKRIVAHGRLEPLALDAEGRVYCSRHGGQVDPGYDAAVAAYRLEREMRRADGLRILEDTFAEDTVIAPR